MRYRVIVARGALAEAEAYAEFIRKRSNDDVASDLWWNGLLDAIFSLEQLPTRCPLIAEQADFSEPVHQLYVRIAQNHLSGRA
jgi:hypothetical protein